MKPMDQESLALPLADRFRRSVLMVVIAVALLGTLAGWSIMRARGLSSATLEAVQVASGVVLLTLLLTAWLKWLPQRLLELSCLVFAAAVCITCMALRMYSPTLGAAIDLEPLYLWIPMVYVLAFMLTHHRLGLVVSLCIFGLFVLVSLPYLVLHFDGRHANFTIQLHVVSAALIATLYFFSTYQHRLRLVQVKAEQFARLSNTDDLTRLPNRRHMAAMIGAALEPAAEGRRFAVMLLDIDHFKQINDRLGHVAGDAALVGLAESANEVLRGKGALARWGGDEFMALVRDVDAAAAERLARTLCSRIAAAAKTDDRTLTISCGVTLARKGDSIDSLVQRADAALYAAKRGGRARVEIIAAS